MIDQYRVREMLHRRANSVPMIVIDPPKAARRARRRLLANGAIAAAAAAAIAVATFTGLHAIRTAPVPADRPTPSPASGVLRANGEVLSFTGGDLVAVNPETGEERVLVKDLGMVWAAEWSADGRWVAYERPSEGVLRGPNDSPDPIALWVVGPSQEPRRVATGVKPGGFVHVPALTWMWSPTGAELATIDGSTLSTIDPVTGETHNVGSIREGVGDVTSPPAWSPDGTRFVVGARGGALYSFDVRTGARSLLVRLPGDHLDSVDQIVWSPDGAHLAVMNDLEAGTGRLYVLNADGSSVRVVVDDFGTGAVAWSPDGTRLAYADGSGRLGKLRLWVAPMDGSAPAEIGSPPAASCVLQDLLCDRELTWSPDGSRIAVRTYGDGSVVLSAIDADGSGHVVRIDELTYRSWGGGGYSWTSRGGR
jgi:Tol biopolymer transport system component